MSKLIDIEILKYDLLKPISECYDIPYNDLLDILNSIQRIRTTNSKYTCDHNFFSKNLDWYYPITNLAIKI